MEKRRYRAGEEADAATVGLLLHPHRQHRTNLKCKELQAVGVAFEGVVVNALNTLRIED